MATKTPDQEKVQAHFDSSPVTVYRESELSELQAEYGRDWNVPPRMTNETFREWLLQNTKITSVKLKSRSYPALTRYVWGRDTRPVSIALSIKRFSYCCHGTALWIHGLGGKSDEIFVNTEQSEKSNDTAGLTQEAIDRAFRNMQRTSNLVYLVEKTKITMVSGKHTNRLEVRPFSLPSGHVVDVTSMERTLIDAAVRPSYSGGVSHVLEAFRLARGRISVKLLSRVLQKLDHTYPYHQAIGFYLEHGGYPQAECGIFAEIDKEFNFYLCHGLKKPAFDPRWRVFFPSNMLRG